MRKDLVKIVIVGHIDHGKSTFIGRILYDLKSMPADIYKKLQLSGHSKKTGLKLASLLDSFEEEQNQERTIDTTRVRFSTVKRDYAVIDAPGHKEFLKNMMTGATSAEAAILLIDAQKGIKDQTKRHAYILSLLGIKQIIVVINKMDLVGFDSKKFNALQKKCLRLFKALSLKVTAFLPVSAFYGDNVVTRSSRMNWYKANTVIEELDGLKMEDAASVGILRFPVQDVYDSGGRKVVAGRIESGRIRVGDEVLISPSNKKSTVISIEKWNTPRTIDSAQAKESVGIVLKDALHIERGCILSHPVNAPNISHQFKGNIFWMGSKALTENKKYIIKLATQEIPCKIISIEKIIDILTLENVVDADASKRTHNVAEVTLKTDKPIVFDDFSNIRETGRFVIVDGYEASGGGIITHNSYPDRRQFIHKDIKSKNIVWHKLKVSRFERGKAYNHKGAVVWLTGLPASGKSTIAMELEHALFHRGVHTFVLDGDNVRTGLNRDLGFSPDDRAENIRRIAEVAKLFCEAGILVITAFISPYKDDRNLGRGLVGKRDFIEVFVDCPIDTCEKRDPKKLYAKARKGEISDFTGVSAPYEAPEEPQIHLRTDLLSVDESVETIISYLRNHSYLGRRSNKKGF